jgi:putative ABC transport system permease protein
MKFVPLLVRNLLRRKIRTTLTLLGIVVAFVLFGLLAAIEAAFSMGVELAGNDRLVLIHKVSLIQLLPESYLERIRAVPGVVDACHQTWFGGIYQDPKNFFMQIPVDPECHMKMFPEFLLPDAQQKAWFADRQGAIAGRKLAERYGWKVGDRIPLQATIWRKKDNSTNWEFNLDGIYDGAAAGTDTTQFFFHYKYLDESRLFAQGQVGWYYVRIADPSKAPDIAARLDALFANSPAETKTTTEKAFAQAFAKQVGDIGLIVRTIGAAVFFTLLLGVANTMAQSVRERTSELAVLKALGFSDGRILALVLAESCLLAAVGGAVGLGLAAWVVSLGDPTGGLLPGFFLPARALAFGAALFLALGFVAGVFPAVRGMRLRIVDALRRA